MVMKQISKSISLCAVVEKRIKTNDIEQLEIVKNVLKSRLATPVGWHMQGLPLLISMMMSVFSFALIISSGWTYMVYWMNVSERAAASGILPAALLYSAAIITSMYFVARGYLIALIIYIGLTFITTIGSLLFFLMAVTSLVMSSESSSPSLIIVALSLIFSLIALKCINSSMFRRAVALFLHNRVWRKQLNIESAIRE